MSTTRNPRRHNDTEPGLPVDLDRIRALGDREPRILLRVPPDLLAWLDRIAGLMHTTRTAAILAALSAVQRTNPDGWVMGPATGEGR